MVPAMHAGVSIHHSVSARVSRGGRDKHSTRVMTKATASSSERVTSNVDKSLPPTHPSTTRRATIVKLLVGLVSANSLANPSPTLAATMPETEPTGLLNGRLRKCPSTFNCVSTSSTGGAPEQFATAWTASTATLDDAVAQITAAVLRAVPDARKLEAFETEDGNKYLRFAMLGKLGVDNVEFLIKNEGIGNRNWEGDEGREKEWLVTYRSLATTVKYVYPFMTPVSDFGEQKKRMERIRKEVEWRRVGCEIEEYCSEFD